MQRRLTLIFSVNKHHQKLLTVTKQLKHQTHWCMKVGFFGEFEGWREQGDHLSEASSLPITIDIIYAKTYLHTYMQLKTSLCLRLRGYPLNNFVGALLIVLF